MPPPTTTTKDQTMENTTCWFCGDDLTEDQIEAGEEFCSRTCENESAASDAEDRANESARYGDDY